MDRNSAIGLTLIAVLLLAYFYWFSPKPQPQSAQPVATESPAADRRDSVQQQNVLPDSALVSTYGSLSSFVRGVEKNISVRTEDLNVVLSNKGGVLREVELIKYKTYSQKPLKLVTAE